MHAARVGIVGGGIGGLTAALSLLRRGFDVQVFERAAALTEIGAGVQISPNASRVLRGLGLAEDPARAGVRPLTSHQRRWDDGRTLLRNAARPSRSRPRSASPTTRCTAPTCSPRWRARCRPSGLISGTASTGLRGPRRPRRARASPTATAPRSTCSSAPTASTRRVRRAAVRAGEPALHRLRRLPRAGAGRARSAISSSPVSAQVLARPRRRTSCTTSSRRGGWSTSSPSPSATTWTREVWTDRGERRRRARRLRGLAPAGARRSSARVDETFIWALFDRAAAAALDGRAASTLLGDACHPMLPFMAQGAAQAIEDGAALAACLRAIAGRPCPPALRRYEATARCRARRGSRRGRAVNKTRFHLPDGPDQEKRDARMAAGATDWSFANVAWIYVASPRTRPTRVSCAAALTRSRAAA